MSKTSSRVALFVSWYFLVLLTEQCMSLAPCRFTKPSRIHHQHILKSKSWHSLSPFRKNEFSSLRRSKVTTLQASQSDDDIDDLKFNVRSYTSKRSFNKKNVNKPPSLEDLGPDKQFVSETAWSTITFRVSVLVSAYCKYHAHENEHSNLFKIYNCHKIIYSEETIRMNEIYREKQNKLILLLFFILLL